MVSYWIKAASNTFENTYWLKQIELVFMTSIEDNSSGRDVGSYTNLGSV